MPTPDMFGIEPLTPAYGRDYGSVTQVKYALYAGLDFKAANGQYCSIRDLKGMGAKTIQVRYNKGVMGYEDTCLIDLG